MAPHCNHRAWSRAIQSHVRRQSKRIFRRHAPQRTNNSPSRAPHHPHPQAHDGSATRPNKPPRPQEDFSTIRLNQRFVALTMAMQECPTQRVRQRVHDMLVTWWCPLKVCVKKAQQSNCVNVLIRQSTIQSFKHGGIIIKNARILSPNSLHQPDRNLLNVHWARVYTIF